MLETVEVRQDVRHYTEQRVEQTIRGFLLEFQSAVFSEAGLSDHFRRDVSFLPKIRISKNTVGYLIDTWSLT